MNYRIFLLILPLLSFAVTLHGHEDRPGNDVQKPALLMNADTILKREVVAMSLTECLNQGLRNNFDILIELNNQRIAENNATKGNAGYYPGVSLSTGYSGTLNNIHQKLSNGGSVNNNGIHNANINAGLNASWMLFEGFNIRTTYEKLLELQKMGEMSTRLAIENFITDLTSEYYGYVRQYRRLENLKYAVSLSQERVRIVETHYQVGTMSRLDLQQAKVDLNSDMSDLTRQYETLHTVQTLLNQLLANEDVDFPIVARDSVIVFDPSLDHGHISEMMLRNNIYLEIAAKNEDISRLDLKIVQSGRYPYIRINGGYGYTHNWYGSGTYDRQRNLGLDYGVSIGFNIFDGHNQRRREKNARIDIENQEIVYKRTEVSLKKALSDAWMSYRNNIQLTELEKANLSTARDLYEIAIERYKLGTLSGIELREAQNSLLDAEERMVQAEYNTKMSEITLLNLSGEVFRYLEY